MRPSLSSYQRTVTVTDDTEGSASSRRFGRGTLHATLVNRYTKLRDNGKVLRQGAVGLVAPYGR